MNEREREREREKERAHVLMILTTFRQDIDLLTALQHGTKRTI